MFVECTNSAISDVLAKKLELAPIGSVKIELHIELPNHILIKDLIVNDFPACNNGFGILIGMDIITLGDFSITNHNGRTCLSFRMPSSHELDYLIN